MKLRESVWNPFWRSNFLIKLRSWEYWPFGIIHFPFFAYWLWFSLKERSLLFFSASNPSIPTGGMIGESKFDVLEKIPSHYKPISAFIAKDSSTKELENIIENARLVYPIIFKPDRGERGWLVSKIENYQEAFEYLKRSPGDFIAQEYVDAPFEFGIFYRRIPSQQTGKVTSIVMKEMLYVIGDGSSSLQELILHKDRAKLQWDLLKIKYKHRLHEVLPAGESIQLVNIGNHCLGTTFIDRNDLINEQINSVFDLISKQIQGFYFGRFDLRVTQIEDLYSGKIKIMELNGCGAEPAHIYQPGYPLIKAMKVMHRHWCEMYHISKENHKLGVPYMSLKEGVTIYKRFKKLQNSV